MVMSGWSWWSYVYCDSAHDGDVIHSDGECGDNGCDVNNGDNIACYHHNIVVL